MINSMKPLFPQEFVSHREEIIHALRRSMVGLHLEELESKLKSVNIEKTVLVLDYLASEGRVIVPRPNELGSEDLVHAWEGNILKNLDVHGRTRPGAVIDFYNALVKDIGGNENEGFPVGSYFALRQDYKLLNKSAIKKLGFGN